jgi:hypothetical protein
MHGLFRDQQRFGPQLKNCGPWTRLKIAGEKGTNHKRKKTYMDKMTTTATTTTTTTMTMMDCNNNNTITTTTTEYADT